MRGDEAIIDPAAHESFKQTQKGRNLSSSDSEVQSVNWKELGMVTGARWQGYYCNASWAIAAVTALESMQAIHSEQLPPVKLSEQEALDCTSAVGPTPNNCVGGWHVHYWDWAAQNGA